MFACVSYKLNDMSIVCLCDYKLLYRHVYMHGLQIIIQACCVCLHAVFTCVSHKLYTHAECLQKICNINKGIAGVRDTSYRHNVCYCKWHIDMISICLCATDHLKDMLNICVHYKSSYFCLCTTYHHTDMLSVYLCALQIIISTCLLVFTYKHYKLSYRHVFACVH